MSEIKFAVWNMEGLKKADLKKEGDAFEKHQLKISRMLNHKIHNEQADFVFFQEIADLKGSDCPEVPYVAHTWFSCRKDCNAMGACRGVRLYQKNGTPYSVEEDFLGFQDPVGVKYTIKEEGKDILHFVGFWNIPEKGTGNYLEHLRSILKSLPRDPSVPYIIAGDTNVNIDSENAAEHGPNNAEKCNERKTDLAAELSRDFDLSLIGACERGVFTLDYLHSQRFFRCDLLMVSSGIVKEQRLNVFSLGKTSDTIEKKLNFWNSDHLPLFFSYSYNLPREER